MTSWIMIRSVEEFDQLRDKVTREVDEAWGWFEAWADERMRDAQPGTMRPVFTAPGYDWDRARKFLTLALNGHGEYRLAMLDEVNGWLRADPNDSHMGDIRVTIPRV